MSKGYEVSTYTQNELIHADVRLRYALGVERVVAFFRHRVNPLLGREPPESTAELLAAGAGVLLSSASQLARRPAGTLDNNFTLLAHYDVLCA